MTVKSKIKTTTTKFYLPLSSVTQRHSFRKLCPSWDCTQKKIKFLKSSSSFKNLSLPTVPGRPCLSNYLTTVSAPVPWKSIRIRAMKVIYFPLSLMAAMLLSVMATRNDFRARESKFVLIGSWPEVTGTSLYLCHCGEKKHLNQTHPFQVWKTFLGVLFCSLI